MKQLPALLPSTIFEGLFNIAEYSKLNKEEKKMYDASLKARWDNQNAMDYAIEQGLKQGLEQGLEQGKAEGKYEKAIEIARKMKKRGDSLSEIIEMTGLGKKEIEQL